MFLFLLLRRDVVFARRNFGGAELVGHDVSGADSVNEHSTLVKSVSLLVEVFLERVDMLAEELHSFAFRQFCPSLPPLGDLFWAPLQRLGAGQMLMLVRVPLSTVRKGHGTQVVHVAALQRVEQSWVDFVTGGEEAIRLVLEFDVVA